MAMFPGAGLEITGGATTLALTTAAAQVVSFSGTGGSADASYSGTGDPAVRTDKANNRLLINTPGRYAVFASFSGTMTTGCDAALQVRKNAVTGVGTFGKARITTNYGQVIVKTIVDITNADILASQAQKTMADASTTGYGGASGAPSTEVPLDCTIKCLTSTDTFTIVEARFEAYRIDV